MKKLFTILVPTSHRHSGNPIHTRHHRIWDEKIRAITGGLTIMPPNKGQWVAPDGTLFAEYMIPVLFMATETERNRVMKLTLDYYDQLAIMCWETSANVKMLKRSNKMR